MRIIILFSVLFLNGSYIISQEVLDSPLLEIFTLVEDSSPDPQGEYSFTLSSIGTAWKVIRYSSQRNLYDISSNVSGGTVYPVVNAVQSEYTGFNYILNDDHSYPEFGFGLYKLKDSLGNYFYLDYRDTRYSMYINCTGHCADIWVKYNVNTTSISLKSGSNWGPSIINGSYYKIWDIKGQGIPVITSDVDSFWQNALVIIYSPNNKIRPVWGPNPNQNNISKYYLYRNVNNGGFTRIGEFNNQTFDYIDNSILYTGEGGSVVSYKVTSYNGTEYTPTNIAVQEYYFEFDWSHGLILTNNGTHPKLVWVPNPNFNATSYRIYRAVSNTPVNKPMTLSYSLIQQNIPSTTFEYTDYAVDMISGYQYAYYYVKAYNGSTESSETNYVGTPAQFNKQLPEVVIIPKENILFQNYPNPFNPATRISYSIKEEGLVTLKIYDVLGKEVVTLVNENKPAGNYEVNWNAFNLPSGMYIYKIQAGSFVQTRKMILLK